MVRQCRDLPVPQGAQGGILDRFAGVFIDDVEDIRQGPPRGVGGSPASQGLGHVVHERDPAIAIGADHRVADARQRDPQPLRLLSQGFLGTLAGSKNALRILQGDGAQAFLLVIFGRHQTTPSSTEAS